MNLVSLFNSKVILHQVPQIAWSFWTRFFTNKDLWHLLTLTFKLTERCSAPPIPLPDLGCCMWLGWHIIVKLHVMLVLCPSIIPRGTSSLLLPSFCCMARIVGFMSHRHARMVQKHVGRYLWSRMPVIRFPLRLLKCIRSLPHHTDVNTRTVASRVEPSIKPCAASLALDVYPTSRQHHAGEDQHWPAPDFEVPVPAQAPPVMPNVPDWDDFARELAPIFDEAAEVEIAEEGPVALVTTWYVHHDRAPSCLVGRLVRLSHRPVQWLELLCAPWIHMIVPFENIAFRIVKPTPTSDVPGLKMIHVILEQGIQRSRYVALFSALFQGLHGDVTHRRAQSVPTLVQTDHCTYLVHPRALQGPSV